MQIGPRIRVGGTLGKIGQNVKIGAGKVLANPIVDTALAFVPGVGPGMAAGARALGTALDTSHGSVSPIDIAKAGVEQYALNRVATSLPGKIGDVVGGFKNGGISGGVQSLGNLAKGSLGSLVGGEGGGGIPGLGGVQGLGDLAKYGLGAAQLYNQAALQKKSDDYATNAFKDAKAAYDAKAPLRAQGQAGLLNAGRGNPFAVQPLALPGGR